MAVFGGLNSSVLVERADRQSNPLLVSGPILFFEGGEWTLAFALHIQVGGAAVYRVC